MSVCATALLEEQMPAPAPALNLVEGEGDLFFVPPAKDRLATIRQLVAEAAEDAGISKERIFDFTLAISEACANGIEHGAGDDYLWLSLERKEKALSVEVSSPGRFELQLGRRRYPYDRGLVLPLMVALADQVTFSRLPQGGTKVTLEVNRD